MPASPENFAASADDGSSIVTLSWTAPVPSDGVTGYRIVYSPYGDRDEAELLAGATDQEAIVENLVPGIEYTFTITSIVQNDGEDQQYESSPVTVTYTIGTSST